MGIREMIQNMGAKGKERKEMIRQMDEQIRMEKIVQDRQRSSNERELLGYEDEDREAMIKERLELARKKRDRDINFNHNPIDAKNIMKAEWEVLREKSQFSGKSNMFTNENSIMKDNKKLLRSSDKVIKGGNMFKI